MLQIRHIEEETDSQGDGEQIGKLGNSRDTWHAFISMVKFNKTYDKIMRQEDERREGRTGEARRVRIMRI